MKTYIPEPHESFLCGTAGPRSYPDTWIASAEPDQACEDEAKPSLRRFKSARPDQQGATVQGGVPHHFHPDITSASKRPVASAAQTFGQEDDISVIAVTLGDSAAGFCLIR